MREGKRELDRQSCPDRRVSWLWGGAGITFTPDQLQGGLFAIPSRCPCSFQAMFDWLDNAVIKLCNMSPVGTDLSTVKEQMNEMKIPGRGGRGSAALPLLTELQ